MMDRQEQLATLSEDLRSNPVQCPRCGQRSSVYRTQKNRRNRKCDHCGMRYATQEVHQSEVNRLLGMVDLALQLHEESASV